MSSSSKIKTVKIERLAFRGEGVGRVDQKVIFVPHAVPGDEVRVRLTEQKKSFDRGEIVDIVTPSPSRVEAKCAYFGKCGGCQWQHIDYAEQIKSKEEIFRQTLMRVGKIADPKILPILSAHTPWHYRQRIQLKVDSKSIGFYEAQSHTIVPIEKCEIANPLINEALMKILSNPQIPSEDFEISLVKEGGRDVVKVLPMSHQDRFFVQAHPVQNELMVQAVLHFVFGRAEKVFKMKKNILELYAGSGNFTFLLAEHAGRVVAIEENPAAVMQGEKRTNEEGLTNLEWICGTSEWGLKKVLRKKLPIDTVVLDPPRQGASDIIDLLLLLKPKNIVYISCDPNTLARDLNELTKRFYRFDHAQPIDMFPQTYHIESVTKLNLL